MRKNELVAALDGLFADSAVDRDSSKNGLQVDCEREEITMIGVAVDATSYVIERAAELGVELLFVHHGMYWGRESALTGVHYDRASKLLRADMALYAQHLPLDRHPEVGNNVVLLRSLLRSLDQFAAVADIVPFGQYEGVEIGYGVRLREAVTPERLREAAADIGIIPELYHFSGAERIASICVITGGGGDQYADALTAGYDVYVTGEALHYHLVGAREVKQSVLLGGHYETETFGPGAVGEWLSEKFGLDCVFIDMKYE